MGFMSVSVKQMSAIVALSLLMVTVAGCTTDDDEGDEPTATVAQATATIGPTESTGGEQLISGQAISDGICLAVIPDGWVDDGTGRGQTSGSGRFVLFGGNVVSDTAWQAAVNVVATPTAGRSIASSEQTADSIYIEFADDRGFEYRKRFGGRYCDLTVTASGPFSPEERAVWPAIMDTLEPVSR